jgi:hypothetical protein
MESMRLYINDNDWLSPIDDDGEKWICYIHGVYHFATGNQTVLEIIEEVDERISKQNIEPNELSDDDVEINS